MQVVRIQKRTHGDGMSSYVNISIRNNGQVASFYRFQPYSRMQFSEPLILKCTVRNDIKIISMDWKLQGANTKCLNVNAKPV